MLFKLFSPSVLKVDRLGASIHFQVKHLLLRACIHESENIRKCVCILNMEMQNYLNLYEMVVAEMISFISISALFFSYYNWVFS